MLVFFRFKFKSGKPGKLRDIKKNEITSNLKFKLFATNAVGFTAMLNQLPLQVINSTEFNHKKVIILNLM